MSLFKKIFGTGNDSSDEESQNNLNNKPSNLSLLPVDEKFTYNFKNNGGKFLYCESLDEVKEQFLNILEENDWFECEALCYELKLFSMLDENKLKYQNPSNPKFLFASCENLIADDGSVLFSSNQIKQNRPNDLPSNIIILAKTSQIIEAMGDGLRGIKKNYQKNYPTNITTIKYFEKVKEEDFLHYGSVPKNMYLLLLEDL
jgi:hypothetical protein